MSKITKILVTGGTGFIGGFLLPRLIESGQEVFVITRKLPAVKKIHNLRYLKADLCDTGSLLAIKRQIGSCEALIDLAALIPAGISADKQNIVSNALQSIKANIIGHVNLLNFIGNKLKKIIYVSSIDVYGPLLRATCTEELPTAPETFYGATKLFVERAYKIFCDKNKIDLVTLRFSQIYGPGEHPINVIPIFIDKIKSNLPLPLFGDGRDTRSFLYVDDAVDAICLAMKKNKKGVFNVAGTQTVSINNLIRMLQILSKKPVKLQHLPRKKRPSRQNVDIEKAGKYLGFHPRISIKQGLAKMIKEA